MKHFLKQTGFTLIEVLIVMGVLGVLASVVIVGVNPQAQLNKGKDAQRKSDLSQIQSALEFYRTDSGSYPTSLPACGAAFTNTIGTNTVTYINKMPCDPTSGTRYGYLSPSGNSNYCLKACLQNSEDPDRDELNPSYGANNPGITETGCAINTVLTCGGSSPTSYTVTNP